MTLLHARGCAFAAVLVVASCGSETPPPSTYYFAHRVSESAAEFDEMRFRSFRKDGRLASTVTLGDPGAITESRLSLVPPIPSTLTYNVSVPPEGRLDFEIGVATLGAEALPAPIVFTVLVDGERAFEETVRRRFGNRWYRRNLDLSDWSDTAVAITFETQFQETPFTATSQLRSNVLPAWGNPVLRGRHDFVTRPDLILVSIDCLRADHVGAYGYELPITPALDAFAEDGALFENSVSVSSWTLPTHMSMLTGLMPTEHGLSRAHKRSPAVPYLPEILSREGYETLGVVSGLYLSPTFGYEQDFDVYRALIDEPAEELVDAAAELFFAEPRRPRFLFLHFFDAHWRYLPPPKYLERAGGRPPDISKLLNKVIQEKPPSGPEEIAQMKTLYDAEVAYVDDQLVHWNIKS